MNEKRLRFDLFVAVTALLVSTIAAAASVYQTRVIAKQTEIINEEFGATTWPYLGFTSTYSPDELIVELRNVGLGPAILRDVDITRDGVSMTPGPSHSALNSALEPEIRRAIADADQWRKKHHARKASISTSISSLSSGDVLPAGEKVQLIRADGPIVVKRFVAARSRIGINICYCSLLSRCWVKTFQLEDSPPREVTECPLHSKP
jgi:hypothetical protein